MLKILKKTKGLKNKNQQKGIALVIAITVTTLLLSISLSISNIVLRQIKITNTNNESKPAFFIADSAIECVTYYDTLFISGPDTADSSKTINTNKVFSTMVFGQMLDTSSISTIRCGNYLSNGIMGKPLGLKKVSGTIEFNAPKITTTFDIAYDTEMCASVEVIRTGVETTITARGYNVGVNEAGDGCDLTNLDKKRVLERGLTVKY